MKERNIYCGVLPRAGVGVAVAILLLAEAVLWVLVQIDLSDKNRLIDYSSVVLAVVFGLLTALANPRGEWLLRVGLVFTLLADYHLVYSIPMNRLLGMVFFNITQLCYFLYLFLSDDGGVRKFRHLVLRFSAILLAVSLCLAVLGERADTLSVISMVYFANLLVSAVWCLVCRRYLLFAGLVAFALCDLTVGMQALIDLYLDVSEGSLMWQIVNSEFDFTWFFYLPSQTVIALCTLGGDWRGVGRALSWCRTGRIDKA